MFREKKPDFKNHSPLSDGDIVISLSKTVPVTSIPDKTFIAQLAAHATVYFQSDIVHASPAARQGNKVHKLSIFDEFEKDEYFGSVLVFHCKDPDVQKHTASFAENVTKTKMRTPFTKFNERRADFNESKSTPELEVQRRKLELFRAFRAHQRIKLLQPISKNKGVSCGNFISYLAKAAIVEKLFPLGLPDSIKTLMESIEKIRLSAANKKLDKVDQKEIETFEKIVKENVSPADLGLLDKLRRPVKYRSVKEFVEDALNDTQHWEWGYFFYAKGCTPSMMKHELYVNYEELSKTAPKKCLPDKGLNLYRVEVAERKRSEPRNAP